MERPSVLFVNRVYPPERGATGRILRDLAKSFAREGWLVTVVTTGTDALIDRDGSIRVVQVKGPGQPSKLGYLWVWIKLLFAVMKQKKHHLLVTMTDPPLLVLVGNIYSFFKKTHHIHWCQNLYPDVLPALATKLPEFLLNIFKRLSMWGLKSCDRVVVIGRCMARQITLDGIDPTKITVIANWPDQELVNPKDFTNGFDQRVQDVEGAKAPDDLIKDAPKFRVLYAGNIGEAHPTESILDAAEILKDEHPEIEFIFVGEGKRFDQIAETRQKRGLENVRLLPFQPPSRLKQLMESGDLHLISMKEEAAGYIVPCKLYSALAVKRPCVLVGPQQSETAKVISDYKAGAVVPQENAKALAEEIKRFRLNGDDWHAAHDGAANASKVFVPGQSIDAWLERAWDVIGPDLKYKKAA